MRIPGKAPAAISAARAICQLRTPADRATEGGMSATHRWQFYRLARHAFVLEI
jgi:hypothetical protein